MSGYIEKRAETRLEFKSPVKIKNIKTGAFSNARMVNYCNNGVYLESNRVLVVGVEVFIGIENSPFSVESDVFDVYRAKVLWRRPVRSAFYKFGYGVQLISVQPGDPMRVKGGAD